MKSNQSSLKQLNSLRSIGETMIEDSDQPSFINQKLKNSLLKIQLATATFSQNQISSALSSNKQSQNPQNLDQEQKQSLKHKKQRKSNKKKNIEKNIIVRSRNRDGKSSRIMKQKQELKRKRLEKKAQRLKQKMRKERMRLKLVQKKTKSSCEIQKTIKTIKSVEKDIKINFDNCAQIKQIGFDRKQIQKKRDDLMKRLVDDWEWLQKSRCERRQLRILSG